MKTFSTCTKIFLHNIKIKNPKLDDICNDLYCATNTKMVLAEQEITPYRTYKDHL